ncbi:hypothetical protein F5146DRAFT_1006586 [Armillaria mellea]|nr:hypothetical protein F5146DRAFT_1006586 [Armillaria mellea]
MSRVSKKHETRILQLLKGPAAIPLVYAYGQLEHFEYIAMDILGSSHAEHLSSPGDGVMLMTVIRIVDQLACSWRDWSISTRSGSCIATSIPDNLLCALDDLTIKLSTLEYPSPFPVFQLRSQEIVRLLKSSCSGKDLCAGFPVHFGDLLDYSRSLDFDQLPDYGRLRPLFPNLTEAISDGPLDWRPSDQKTMTCVLDEPQLEISEDEDGDDADYYAFLAEDSYYELDLDMWDNRQRERDKDLTLPVDQEVYLDSCTPLIAEVER